MLDYKIKDLNRQIEPRENEITDMKENITEMDHELEQYHKMNASLDQMIGSNRTVRRRRRRSRRRESMSRNHFYSNVGFFFFFSNPLFFCSFFLPFFPSFNRNLMKCNAQS